jgi:hypothetical protein
MLNERQDVFSLQRTPQGQRYEKMMAKLQEMRASGDPSWQRARSELFAGCVEKSLGVESVYSNKTLQTMSVQYANDAYIGDRLMPIINAGNQPTGVYFVYDKRMRLAYPDDLLGDRGIPNEIDDARSTASFSCKDRGFTNSISKKVVDAADAPLDEMMDLTESINEGLAFKREKRQATILTTAANFGSNTTALAAANRWDSAGGGNPIKDIQAAKAALWQGRGPGAVVGYCSRTVWDVLARHPQILDLFKFNGSSPGLATPDMLASWFGLQSILVGDAREDTANIGAAASYSRIWSDVFGMVRVAARPSIRNASFGYTFRLNGVVKSSQWYDGRVGYDGRWYAKVAVSDDEKVVASDTGFLITTPTG